jgi:Mn-dependent DtxR family transcriptional regulator
MSFDAMVLRAMLRLARRREAADEEALALRVGSTRGAVRAAVRRLGAGGLVQRRAGGSPSLTMAGLAVAIALLPAKAPRVQRATARSSSRAA